MTEKMKMKMMTKNLKNLKKKKTNDVREAHGKAEEMIVPREVLQLPMMKMMRKNVDGNEDARDPGAQRQRIRGQDPSNFAGHG